MHQPADPAVAGSLSLSARSGKSLQSVRASLAGSRSGHVSRHSLRAAEVGVGSGRETGEAQIQVHVPAWQALVKNADRHTHLSCQSLIDLLIRWT